MAEAAAHTEGDRQQPEKEEWIYVKPKSRFRRNPPNHPAARKKSTAPQTGEQQPQPRSHRSVADIAAEYDTFRTRWRDTPCCSRLRDLVKSNAGRHRTVRRAVCLGVGTFDPEDGGWDAKRRSFIQLDAFLAVVEVLCMFRRRYAAAAAAASPSQAQADGTIAEVSKEESIPCSFQEPRFTPHDVEFLTNLGHEVVESPAAFEVVDEDTLVFAIHMYRPIYEAALEKALPAMFVGTGWDVWDEFGTMQEGEFKCMSDMHASHEQYAFPKDGTYTTFSSTCIYWRPKPESLDGKEEDLEETPTEVAKKVPEEGLEGKAEEVSEAKEASARPPS